MNKTVMLKETHSNNTQTLKGIGQSLWLDNITRTLLDDGTLQNYINQYSVTGLTSNPSIFNEAIGGGAYDEAIQHKSAAGKTSEVIFTEIALEDLRRAADLFRPIFDATEGVDGWVSMEVSPLLAADIEGSIAAAKSIHAQADRQNLFVKIPGTPEGVSAIEELIYVGIPINVTLLFSSEQYLAAANAYLRGIERRIADGLDPKVASVASIFVSRWDKAANGQLPEDLHNRTGIAVAEVVYCRYCELLDSARWKKLAAAGAKSQRLLWASTGSKDPQASETLYVEALAAPDTINTMPEKTLKAYADQGVLSGLMQKDGGDDASVLERIAKAGVDIDAVASQLQREGADAFIKAWNELLSRITSKSNISLGTDKVQG